MSLITRQESPSFAPRASLQGIDLPANFALPPLAAVRRDAALLPAMKRKGPGTGTQAVWVGSDGQVKGKDTLNEPLAWSAALPNLIKWSYFVDELDVPDDLREETIWALRMFLRVLEESSESSLRAIGHILPHQKAEDAKYFMGTNSLFKLSSHLLNPKTNRPADAVPVLRKAVALDADRQGKLTGERPWKHNPLLYAQYGHALALSGVYNDDAKLTLERALEYLPSFGAVSDSSLISSILKSRVDLAILLRNRGVETEKAQRLEEEAIKFLRKNPSLLPHDDLRQLLIRPGQPENRVLSALGGPKFLEKHDSFKTLEPSTRVTSFGLENPTYHSGERQDIRSILETLVNAVRKPVFLIGTIYWHTTTTTTTTKSSRRSSKECQKKNWKAHKESCRDYVSSLKRLENLKVTDPSKAQCAADWSRWHDGSHGKDEFAMVHALGLQRDPSRGRTHIIFYTVEYTPEASRDLMHKFQISSAGVFRIKDVLPEIETAMGLDPGEGREYIDGLLAELDTTDRSTKMVPMLFLFIGDKDIQTWLGNTATTLDQVRRMPYNAKWRDGMNKYGPPEKMGIRRLGVQDVEHVFD